MFIAVGLALAALAVAIASWFRPAPEPAVEAAPTFTDAQVAEAKKQVCDAFKLAHDAMFTAGHKDAGPDPVAKLALDANGRLAFFAGASYIDQIIAQYPATPQELIDAGRQYTVAYKQLALFLLNGQSAEQMDQSIVKAGDTANDTFKRLCQ